jgi:hypothetical protein
MKYGGAKILATQTESETFTLGRSAVIQGFTTDANCPTATMKILVGKDELPLYEADGATEWSMPVTASRAYMIGMDVLVFPIMKFALSVAPTVDTMIDLVTKDA